MRRDVFIRSIALLLTTTLLGACGSRVSDDDRTAGTSPGPASTAAPTTAPPASDDSPCGPGDAKGATDIGVTDDAITIHTIQDLSGPQPGLFQSEFDTMKAFVAYCNSLGGINGRELKLVANDSTFFEPRPHVEEACKKAFALVGAAFVFDDMTVDVAEDCGLPEFPSFSSTPAHSSAANVVHAVPQPADQAQAGPAYYFAEHFPDEIKDSAMLVGDAPTTKIRSEQQYEAFEQAGFVWSSVKYLPIIEMNWGPHVEELRSKDVGYATIWSGLEEPAKLVKELKAQGVEIPVVDIQPQSYDQKFLDLAGPAAEGAYVGVSTWPLEEADQNPELQLYAEWLDKTTGAEPTSLGMFTWSAGLFFATIVKDLGDDVTREGLLEAARQVHEWDGHGLHGVGDPGKNRITDCIVMLQVQDGEFARIWPDEGFHCDPRYAATVTDPTKK